MELDRPLASSLATIPLLLLEAGSVRRFLVELAEVATTVVTSPTACGITLRQDEALRTVGSSDARADLLDQTQYRAGEGPCVHSARTGRLVDIPDLAVERRWPGFLDAAGRAGVRCSLSLPLTVGAETSGALNLYGFAGPGVFGPHERRELELFAAQAAGALRLAVRMTKDGELMAQMEEALRSRTSIDQALGIIMARQGCTATAAFEVLRRQSQTGHRPLRVVAAELISRTTGEPPEPGRAFDTT